MLPKHLHRYFWDSDVKKIDTQENKRYIVGRILECGDIEAIRWLLQNFDQKFIKKELTHSRGLTARSANFWRLFFNVPQNKILCLNKSFQKWRKMHWPY